MDRLSKILVSIMLVALAAAPVVADTFSSKIHINLQVASTRALDLLSISGPLAYDKTYTFATGTGANQAQQMFTDSRTISASSTEALDLAGVLTTGLGQTVTFTAIKAIYVEAASGNTNNVVLGGADGAATFINWVSDESDKIILRPGGAILLVAPDATGYAVTATTADLLQVGNSGAGTSVTYTVVIIGEGSGS